MAVVLKGGTLVDGTGAKPLAKAVVVIEGERGDRGTADGTN